jgi:hypothetical protein
MHRKKPVQLDVCAASDGAEGLTITLVVHRVSIPNEN